MDAVLQHHPVAHQVEAEPGSLSLAADGRVREPDGRDQVEPGELGQHPGVDFVRLTSQRGQALHLLGVGDIHVPASQLERVVYEAGSVHRLDDRVDRAAIGGHSPYEFTKTICVWRGRRDGELLTAPVERTDVQSLPAEVESEVQHGVWGLLW